MPQNHIQGRCSLKYEIKDFFYYLMYMIWYGPYFKYLIRILVKAYYIKGGLHGPLSLLVNLLSFGLLDSDSE